MVDSVSAWQFREVEQSVLTVLEQSTFGIDGVERLIPSCDSGHDPGHEGRAEGRT